MENAKEENLVNQENINCQVFTRSSCEDFSCLALNLNDSDVNSDDSSAWMHKIDVSNFKTIYSDMKNCPLTVENQTPNFHSFNANNLSSHITSTILTPSRLNYSTSGSSNSRNSSNFQRNNSEPCMKRLKYDATAAPPSDRPCGQSDSSNQSPVKSFYHFHSMPSDDNSNSAMSDFYDQQKMFNFADSNQYFSSLSQSIARAEPFPDYFSRPHQPVRPLAQHKKHQRHQGQRGDASPTASSSSKIYAKPLYSYSCLIALALKNSKNGCLQVSDIYSFMCENFPYFRTAPTGWKNSVRHNLSLNKCFEKIVVDNTSGQGRKCCLWKINLSKRAKMDQEIKKWREKDPQGVRECLLNPCDLEMIESGRKGLPSDLQPQPLILQTIPDKHGQLTNQNFAALDWSSLTPPTSFNDQLFCHVTPNDDVSNPPLPAILFPAAHQFSSHAVATYSTPVRRGSAPIQSPFRSSESPVQAGFSIGGVDSESSTFIRQSNALGRADLNCSPLIGQSAFLMGGVDRSERPNQTTPIDRSSVPMVRRFSATNGGPMFSASSTHGQQYATPSSTPPISSTSAGSCSYRSAYATVDHATNLRDNSLLLGVLTTSTNRRGHETNESGVSLRML